MASLDGKSDGVSGGVASMTMEVIAAIEAQADGWTIEHERVVRELERAHAELAQVRADLTSVRDELAQLTALACATTDTDTIANADEPPAEAQRFAS